jgi:isoleucyl-tRNA synthetase
MSQDKKSYKDTLNLPQTAFDMRAGLLKKEPGLQAKWKQNDLYGKIRAAREGSERFILHDGPPYANGNIHMGTALNKILKDMVIRIKTMSGMDAPYIPGWDCHGLPIEAKVMEELGEKAAQMGAGDIRKRCQEYARKFAAMQSDQFQRLGVLGEFDNPYITMNPGYEAAVLEVFARLVEKGLVYRQLKPVHWSIENRTALADAELEYHDREDSSIYVAFPLVGDGAGELGASADAPVSLLIWTTTPWTLPANLAVAVHPAFQYCQLRVETTDGCATWIVAEERREAVLAKVRADRADWLKSAEVVSTLTGQDLLDKELHYAHPIFADKTCPVVPADYVVLDEGTGLVHTAPGHGMEDYGTGLKNGLEIYCPVQADGTFDDTVPPWLQDVKVWDANAKVIERLQEARTLVLEERITHSYPHDWRSKTPTIFRATEQWFVAVDKPLADGGDTSLREMALEACRREVDDGGVNFVPSWGRNRIAGMLESRPDWCLSRQRFWGLPIPVFYNPSGEPLLTPESVRAVAKFLEAHSGSDAWFSSTPAEILGDYDPSEDRALEHAERFPIDQLQAGRDIFDVWFESGSSWFAVAVRRGLVDEVPVDLYLEGSDQHRGWFQLSLLPALGATGTAPFETVLTHGFVVTEDGHKMSKSLGNTIDAIQQLDKRGADILRLWVASQNYQDDVRCSEALIAQAEDAYRKIRNTIRFCMGACSDFDPAKNATDPSEHSVDRWMKMQLHELIRDVRGAYDRYEFHRATRLIYEFCTVQASSIYLSAVKDRLYCESPDAVRRRSSQTVIHEVLTALVKLLAPILPHTCDEAWEHIPCRSAAEPDAIQFAQLPDYDEGVLRMAADLRPVSKDDATFEGDTLNEGPSYVWERLMALRQTGLIKLEALRNAGVKNSLDAEAVFHVAKDNAADADQIHTYIKELEDLLGVGYARVERESDMADEAGVDVEVVDSRDKYPRCARSWKRRPDVGSDPDHPDLCARDAAVLREIGA